MTRIHDLPKPGDSALRRPASRADATGQPPSAAEISLAPTIGVLGVQGDFVVSVLLPDGTVYVTAGGGSGARLDPATGAWSDVDDGPAMPIVRSATSLLDGRVLFIGFNEARTESPAELFDPAALR